MENINLGQISQIVLFLSTFFGAITILFKYIKKWIKEALKTEFNDIKININNLKEDIDSVGISNCKNFLVSCYAKIENNGQLDETEKERYFEEYDIYTNKYHQNSYIHTRHEKLKKEGKL